MELLCLEFVNSEFREFHGRWVRDDLRQPEWLERFLDRWHLRVDQYIDGSIIEDLVVLRTLLIRVVSGLNTPEGSDVQDLATLNALLGKTVFHYQVAFIDRKFHLSSQPFQQNWDWVRNKIIVDFFILLTNYDSRRLKMCRNPHCRWIFYDQTKSRTRRYCSIDKCANLMKVRRFRARRRG